MLTISSSYGFSKNFLHNLISKLWSSILVNNTFVVHSARSSAKPTVAHAAIAELPNIDTAAALLRKYGVQLLF